MTHTRRGTLAGFGMRLIHVVDKGFNHWSGSITFCGRQLSIGDYGEHKGPTCLVCVARWLQTSGGCSENA